MDLLQFFLTVQFWSGILIGATFGMMGGLLMGLIVIPPISNEILGLDERTETYPVFYPESKRAAVRAEAAEAMVPPGGRDVSAAPAAVARGARDITWRPSAAEPGPSVVQPQGVREGTAPPGASRPQNADKSA